MKDRQSYINAGGRLIDLTVPKVMGVINITPDSFYKKSRVSERGSIVDVAVSMAAEGAAIIDIGAISSRPGAVEITAEEEGARLFPVLSILRSELPGVPLSIDTYRASVAKRSVLEYGASIINDISGGEADNMMFPVIAELNVPYVLMHMRGNPANMQDFTSYDDVVSDIIKWFGQRIHRLHSMGVKDIIVDPGFGFSKTIEQNFEMLSRLNEFNVTGKPLLAGLSRKATIWKTLGITPDEALNGTTVLNTVALLRGADILRVHDVREAVEAIKLVEKIKDQN